MYSHEKWEEMQRKCHLAAAIAAAVVTLADNLLNSTTSSKGSKNVNKKKEIQ